MKNSTLSSGKYPEKVVKNSLRVYRKALKSKNLPVDKLLHDQNQCNRNFEIIPDEMQISSGDGGVFFGLNPFDNPTYCTHFIGKSQKEDGHILVIGSPGCHKTTGVILPTILTWKGTFFAVDIKGDISDFCIHHYDEIAYPTITIDFANSERSVHFDPFKKLHTDGEKELVSNARELALAIIPTPHDVREPFWVQGAQGILTSVILYAIGNNIDFNSMVKMVLSTPAVEILKAIRGSSNEQAKSFVISYHPETDDKILQGCFAEVVVHLQDLEHVQVQRILDSSNSIDFNQIVSTCNLVIQIPESKLTQWSGAVRLILRQLFSTLYNRPEKYSQIGRWQPPFLLLWDELPRFGKFDDLIHAFSTLRSRGVTICTTVQSLAQLDYIYGSSIRRALVDCCAYVIIGTVQDVETQKFCSALIGSSPIWEPSIGDNYHPSREEFSFSRNLNLARKPLIYPEDFASLNSFIVSSHFGKFFVEKRPFFENETLSLLRGCREFGMQTNVKKIKRRTALL